MKQQPAMNRVVKTLTAFEKELGGAITVSGTTFTDIIIHVMRFFALDDDFLVVSNQNQNEHILLHSTCQEKEVFINKEAFNHLIKQNDIGKFRGERKNDGTIFSKKYKSWMWIPISAKKEMYLAIIIIRSASRFSLLDFEAAQELSSYLRIALKNTRARNKKGHNAANETRHKILLRTQTSLGRNEKEFPNFSQRIEYSSQTGSDLGRIYSKNDEMCTAFVCDMTADDAERNIGLIYIDTWFSILSKTTLEIKEILLRLNEDMVLRSAECYASIALVRYTKKNKHIEIAGVGSAIAFVFSHDSMDVRVIRFETAAGIKKDIQIINHRIVGKSGDIICLCTDGLPDARKTNGELFGTSEIADILKKNYFLCAHDLTDKIIKNISESSTQDLNADDKTIQILKID